MPAGKPIKALLVRCGMHPQRITVNNDYESLCAAIGANHLEFLSPFEDKVNLVVNEVGKIDGSKYNRGLVVNGKIQDVIVGDFLVVGDDVQASDICDLKKKQLDKYEAKFWEPEIFALRDDKLIVVPIRNIWLLNRIRLERVRRGPISPVLLNY